LNLDLAPKVRATVQESIRSKSCVKQNFCFDSEIIEI
jgi:hypothetical protein